MNSELKERYECSLESFRRNSEDGRALDEAWQCGWNYYASLTPSRAEAGPGAFNGVAKPALKALFWKIQRDILNAAEQGPSRVPDERA